MKILAIIHILFLSTAMASQAGKDKSDEKSEQSKKSRQNRMEKQLGLIRMVAKKYDITKNDNVSSQQKQTSLN